MYNFLILGQIPGTDVVITFAMWTLLGAAVLGIFTWFKVRSYRRQAEKQDTSAVDFSVAL